MSLIFDRWSTEGIVIRDISLARYISLDTPTVPHSFGRKNQRRFEKATINVVERLINKVMRSGQGKRKLSGKYIRGRNSTGKKIQAINLVENAFEKIEQKTKKNPIQILVEAIENAAPREDITRIKKGGISYSQAVDIAPMRRMDEALKNLALSAFSSSFNNKRKASDSLAEELILASQGDIKSFSVKRRDEVERIAKSSR